jgi:prepilin-type N-terminal cleavage/methylation domain-containing protein
MHRSSGFSLIEVLIATAILVTVAAGTAQLFGIAIRHDVAARQQLLMSAVASTKIDELAASVAQGPAPAASMGGVDRPISGFSDVVAAAGASFERRWLIAPLTGYGATAVVIVLRVSPAAGRPAPDLEVATISEAGLP